MLALVMCLLVVGVASVALRDAMRDEMPKRATAPARPGRDRRERRLHRPRAVRAGGALLVSSVAAGLLLAAAVTALGFLLRAVVTSG